MKKLLCIFVLLLVGIALLTACDAHTHAYGDWTVSKAATCTQKGEETRVCECGETETRETDFAHTFGDWTGSCGPALKQTRTCRCGAKEERDAPFYCEYDTQNVCVVCHTALQSTPMLEFIPNDDGNSYSVKAGTMTMSRAGDIVIPYYYNEKPVTAVADAAFYECNRLSTITLPSTVTTIGTDAFNGCSELTAVTFHGNSRLQEIAPFAFFGCRWLKLIRIPATLQKIGAKAFANCTALNAVYITNLAAWCKIEFELSPNEGLGQDCHSNPLRFAEKLYLNDALVTQLHIDSSIEKISSYAFFSCKSLETVTIANPSVIIDSYAFRECTNLKSVTFSEINNWVATHYTVKTPLAPGDLATPETAASYLRSTYTDCVWKRETE